MASNSSEGGSSIGTGSSSGATTSIAGSSHRFGINEEVIVKFGSAWAHCLVVAHDRKDASGAQCPYQIKVLESSQVYAIKSDDDGKIRKYFASPLEQLKQAIECKDKDKRLASLVATLTSLDLALPNVASALWLHTAKYGCNWMCQHLLAKGILPIDLVDGSGRTVAHIAILNGNSRIFYELLFVPGNRYDACPWLKSVDKDGRNVLHMMVIKKDLALLEDLFFTRGHLWLLSNFSLIFYDNKVHYGENLAFSLYTSSNPLAKKKISIMMWPDAKGQSALSLAIQMKDQSIVDVLSKAQRHLDLLFALCVFDFQSHAKSAMEATIERLFPGRSEITTTFAGIHRLPPATPDSLARAIGCFEKPTQEELSSLKNCEFITKQLDSVVRDANLPTFEWMVASFDISLLNNEFVAKLVEGSPEQHMNGYYWEHANEYMGENSQEWFRTNLLSELATIAYGHRKKSSLFETDADGKINVEQAITTLIFGCRNLTSNTAKQVNFPMCENFETKSVSYHVHRCMPSSMLETFNRTTKEKGQSHPYAPPFAGSISSEMVDKSLIRLIGFDIDRRITMLDWLLQKGLSPPTILLCFLHGQLHLLRWMHEQGKFDMSLPLSTNTALLDYAKQYSWMSADGKAINETMSVAEALCGLAVGLGEFAIALWLLEDVVPDRFFFCGGETMLHLAAQRNQTIVLWYFFAKYSFDQLATAFNFQGLNLMHLAIKEGNVYLFDLFTSTLQREGEEEDFSPFLHANDKHGKSVVEWAEHSPSANIRAWLEKKVIAKRLEKAVIASSMSQAEVQEVLLISGFWEHFESELRTYFAFRWHYFPFRLRAPGLLSGCDPTMRITAYAFQAMLFQPRIACLEHIIALMLANAKTDYNKHKQITEGTSDLIAFLEKQEDGKEALALFIDVNEELKSWSNWSDRLVERSKDFVRFFAMLPASEELLVEISTFVDFDSHHPPPPNTPSYLKEESSRGGISIIRFFTNTSLPYYFSLSEESSCKHSFSFASRYFRDPLEYVVKEQSLPLLRFILSSLAHKVTLHMLARDLLFAAKACSLELIELLVGALREHFSGNMTGVIKAVHTAMLHAAGSEAEKYYCRSKWMVWRDRETKEGEGGVGDEIEYAPRLEVVQYLYEVIVSLGGDPNGRIETNRSNEDKVEHADSILVFATRLFCCRWSPFSKDLFHWIVRRVYDTSDAAYVIEQAVEGLFDWGAWKKYGYFGKTRPTEEEPYPERELFEVTKLAKLTAFWAIIDKYRHARELDFSAIANHICRLVENQFRPLEGGVLNDSNFAFYWSLDDEAGIHSGLVLMKMLMERYHANIQSCVFSDYSLRGTEIFMRQAIYLDALKSEQNTVLKVLKAVWDSKVTTSSLIAQMRDVGSFVPFARDGRGQSFLHAAAGADRTDLIPLLIDEFGLRINDVDSTGMTALKLAESSGSVNARRLLLELKAKAELPVFLAKHFRRRKALRLLRAELVRRTHAASVVQRVFRMYVVYNVYGAHLASRKGTWDCFNKKWNGVEKALRRSQEVGAKAFSWFEEKARRGEIYESGIEDDVEHIDYVSKEEELEEQEEGPEAQATVGSGLLPLPLPPTPKSSASCAVVDHIELAHSVVKWLEKKPDALLRHLFLQRIEALARGHRSHALEKALKTRSVPIYESKVDAGVRMLWTKVFRALDDDGVSSSHSQSILVWYVCAHDKVQKCIENIERAHERMAHQPLLLSSVGGGGGGEGGVKEEDIVNVSIKLSERTVLLDPQSNSPLKTYVVSIDDLKRMNDDKNENKWLPPLRLTLREREINSTKGAILILGRSGTGKSTSLCARMLSDYEAAIYRGMPYTQLFVTRSKRLCQSTELYQCRHKHALEEDEKTQAVTQHFFSLAVFLKRMERSLVAAAAMRRSRDGEAKEVEEAGKDEAQLPAFPSFFLREPRCVGYVRFRDHIFPDLASSAAKKKKKHQEACLAVLDPLIVWTQIRSFIKGSIKAAMQFAPLSLEQYLDPTTGAGQKLTTEQKKECFSLFLKYQEVLKSQELWDDCDRVLMLHAAMAQVDDVDAIDFVTCIGANDRSSEAAGGSGGGNEALGVSRYSAIYVDEIQDCTQAETALFFHAAGNNDGLVLAGDPAQSVVEGVEFRFEFVRAVVYELSHKKASINKPSLLEVNFRSHAGILNVAAIILEKLFAHFPGSATILAKDVGLFLGPRPGSWSCSIEALAHFLESNETIVVLTRDENCSSLAEQVKRLDAVLGIREAKGLEFQEVMIVDFFSQLSSPDDHKAWKRMLIDATKGSMSTFDAPPQLETQLKLLYTAVTRACSRLVFVETKPSQAGGAFARWLKNNEKAEPFVPSTERVFMTSDEWISRGMDFVVAKYDELSDDADADASVAPPPEEALAALRRAQECFFKGGSTRLVEVTRLQQRFLQQVHNLREATWNAAATKTLCRFSVKEELELIKLVVLCIKQSLLTEAKRLVSLVRELAPDHDHVFFKELLRCFDSA